MNPRAIFVGLQLMPQESLISDKRRAGISAPLFSVYSRKSLGIGDFHDLKLLVDWCAVTANSILQLLPLNETGASFCPYDALSSFSLEPAYIFLEPLLQQQKESIKEEAGEVAQLFPPGRPHIDYRIKEEKLGLLRSIFNAYRGAAAEFAAFRQANKYWLEDFALFKALKAHHRGQAWYEWPDGYKSRDPAQLEAFRSTHQKEIEFEIWLQWQLFQQLKEVKTYAQDRGVLIKGDLPILVSRDSADCWQHPEFFKLDLAAGAPPDMYCAKGQRWGMPTYNWENIAACDYKYLIEKLKYAQNFYHMIRVDHVVGLFRIWSIPYHDPLENQGLNGFFDPRDENLWGEHGRMILQMILERSGMFLCAEDLGVIPQVCTDSLKSLGIPGNDVQRWVKDWKIKHDFLPADKYRRLSVTMLSTHDTTNWAAWWEYEAGTIDEALFVRKCNQRGIDYTLVRDRLFDLDLSYHGRLRWLNAVNSVEKLVAILGKKHEEVGDFIDIYLNSFQEKEKLWKLLGMQGAMQEKASPVLIKKGLQFTLDSSAIFCIQLVTDWLSMAGLFKGDSYQYRINTPGSVSEKNWSMTLPLPLEDLIRHRVSGEMKKMIVASGRV